MTFCLEASLTFSCTGMLNPLVAGIGPSNVSEGDGIGML